MNQTIQIKAPDINIAGENSFIIYFAEHASPETSALIHLAEDKIRQRLAQVLIDLVPSYASILIIYDLGKTDHHYIKAQLQHCLCSVATGKNQVISANETIIELPAYYGLDAGVDLARVANHAKLSIDQVIELHQQQTYRVYAIGFAPGFAYLGDVDAKIATPRLSTPRSKVPQGAIAIADQQTAVYPTQSPGGWNIIGLCPTKMFVADQTPTMPVQVGDKVKFSAIDKTEYLRLGGIL